MEIDLNKLNYQDKISIDEVISYDKDYLSNSGILKLDDVKAVGSIYVDYEKNNVINLSVSGQMFILDAITAEEVPYDFQVEIEEILEKSQKTLDLIEFLWHYIVLEIPIRYTTSNTDELKYKDIYHEEEIREVNNPFKDLLQGIGKEWNHGCTI